MKLAILGLHSFGYFTRMAQHISDRGVPATYFDERPSNDVLTKLTFRLAPKALGRRLGRAHIRSVCDRIIAGGYTHVLVIFAEIVSESDLLRLREAGIRISRFTWDSIGNRSDVRALDHMMDAIASFDPEDCKRYGYTYIPLYSEVIAPEKVRTAQDRETDFYFCGTMHSTRPAIMHDIAALCEARGWSTRFSFYYHARALYFMRNLMDRKALRLFARITDVPTPHSETLEESRNARVVLDIHHPRQNGLTMRSFEALAQGAILATTNRAATTLIDASLQDRVVHLDPRNLRASLGDALSRTPGPLTDAQYHMLSLDRYLDQIFALLGQEVAARAPRIEAPLERCASC